METPENDKLIPGLSCETEFVVGEEQLASSIGSGLVSVFSTAMMIARMEATAVECVQQYLPAGMTSVGVHVDIWHKAATPAGMKVRFKATLYEISANGKALKFQLRAWDANEIIGEGIHERVIVDTEKFEAKAKRKNMNQ